MEDPTTLTLNLTYLGTLGVAGFMFLLLGFLVVITLVVAGIVRLVSIVLMAMVGVFPKRDTVPIVHLPPTPSSFPDPASAPGAEGLAGAWPADGPDTPAELEPPTAAVIAASSAAAPLPAAPAAAVVPVSPRRHFFKTSWFKAAGHRIAAMWAKARSIAWWKSTFDPRRLPTPAQIKAWAKRAAGAFFTTQGRRHPFVAVLTHEPPVLSEKWAAAVAQADERAAARAKAAELSKIVVTVREALPDGHAETTPRGKASHGPLSTATSPHGVSSNGKSAHGSSLNGKTPQAGSPKGSAPQPGRGGSLTPAGGARPASGVRPPA